MATNPNTAGAVECTSRERVNAWGVHILTATGLIAGMLALQAIIDKEPRTAILWLLVTELIDGIDGPIARKINVQARVPKINGEILDLVIDFVTCVVVPVAFMYQFAIFGQGPISLVMSGIIVATSAIWFSRNDMMTDDHWFRGFPAMWNLVAPAMFLLDLTLPVAVMFGLVFSILQLTDFPCPHVIRVKQWRMISLPINVLWSLFIALETIWLPERPSGWEAALIWVLPIYLLVIGSMKLYDDHRKAQLAAAPRIPHPG